MNFTRKDFNCAKDYREALEHYTRKLENLVDSHIKAYDAAFNKIVQLQEELSTYSKIELAFDTNSQNLIDENNNLKEQVRQFQESITRYTYTIDSLSSNIDELRACEQYLQQEISKYQNKIEEETRKVDDLTITVAQLRKIIKRYRINPE